MNCRERTGIIMLSSEANAATYILGKLISDSRALFADFVFKVLRFYFPFYASKQNVDFHFNHNKQKK